jgi:hypothetical protein
LATKVTAMKRSGSPLLNKLLSSLPGRIGLVVLTAVLVAAVIPLLFLFNQAIMPVALKIIAIACIGIASGFTARRLLNTNTRLLTMLVAFIAVYASLWLLSILTSDYIGIQPFHSWSGPDWSGLIQLGLATIISWMALQAWKRPSKTGSVTTSPAGGRNRIQKITSPRNHKGRPAPTRIKKSTPRTGSHGKKDLYPNLHLPQFAQTKYWADQWKNVQIRTHRSIHSSQLKLSALLRQPLNQANNLLTRPYVKTRSPQKSIQVRSRKPKVNTLKRTRTNIRLTSAVEHRCPFCLEPVEKKDVRGVKVCPICHTHHHADCWDVTGTCQIPHMHE